MKVIFEVECPYCRVKQKHNIEMEGCAKSHPKVFFCDCEVGGCDKPFAVTLTLEKKVEVLTISKP